jgi:beta-lactam-binding protein with PASTA domain
VPDLTNDTKAAAQAALQAAGLVGFFTTTPVSDKHQDGMVQSQSPSPNSTANKGSTVNVVIGAYNGTTTTTSTTTPTTATT